MDVNFLVKDELQEFGQGKVLKWALNWGKKIVVLTELVVILAFLSRFWLDTTVADLGEKITQKKAIIDASAESEKRFRVLAARVNKATKIENAVSILTIYDKTESLIPAKVEVKQLTVAQKEIAFGGSADEQTLSNMVNAFKNSKIFTNIRVEKITKQVEGQKVDFSFKADYVY